MRSSAVICEFNPFHNGHAYLIGKMREQVGEDGCVVCVMSGRSVQRGELAVADPYLRAQTASAGGADLVLELPYPWSSGSAEHFAAAGVSLATRLGIDTLTFGSETADIHLLTHVADIVEDRSFGERYAALCGRGMGTAAAYAEAIRTLGAEQGTVLPEGFPSPNDLLGIAYIRALRDTPCTPCVVKRVGQGYADTVLSDAAFPSATALRVLIDEAAEDAVAVREILQGTMPPRALDILLDGLSRDTAPVRRERLSPLIHAYYRLTEPDALTDADVAEMGGGLAERICRVARETATPDDFADAIKTKQYTDARLRRACLFGMTGVTVADVRALPTYTTLLAANARGCRFLGEWKRSKRADELTVVTKPADAPMCRQRELGERIDALLTLCLPTPVEAGALMRRSPYIE